MPGSPEEANQAAAADLTDALATGDLLYPIAVLRDRAGVPHVYAATTADLYFGLGFAMAQDRLWQMDRLRRRGSGRQAEILGPVLHQSGT